jgi:carbamate kinase
VRGAKAARPTSKAVYADWGTPEQRAIPAGNPGALSGTEFAAGSIGPKLRAACSFVEETGAGGDRLDH